jgi:hypothetical protein
LENRADREDKSRMAGFVGKICAVTYSAMPP